MSREIHVIWAGRHRREAWEELCVDYRRRVERELPIHDRLVKVKVGGADPGRQKAEEEALLGALPDPVWLIALDSRGKTLSSPDLARRLTDVREQWPHPIAFVIGSDLGLSRPVLDRARLVLSFGPMTLGHELARLVLYEQLYRAISIGRGIKYHRPSF